MSKRRDKNKYKAAQYGPKPKWQPVCSYTIHWDFTYSQEGLDMVAFLETQKIPHKVNRSKIEFSSEEDKLAFTLAFGQASERKRPEWQSLWGG